MGEETRVGRLMHLVEQHSRDRPPIVQFADRIAGRFVRIVLAVAAVDVPGVASLQHREGDRQFRGIADRHLPLRVGTGDATGGDDRPGPRRAAAYPRQGRRSVRGPQPVPGVMLPGQDRHAHRGADRGGLMARR